MCPRHKDRRRFESTYTKHTYSMKHNLTCKLRYVVYLITCEVCGKQYTGKTTTTMHIRHTGHRNEVDNETTELGEHFTTCGGKESMCVQIIDCVKEGEDQALQVLEGYWQNMLATFRVHGNINIRNEWKNYLGQQPRLFQNTHRRRRGGNGGRRIGGGRDGPWARLTHLSVVGSLCLGLKYIFYDILFLGNFVLGGEEPDSIMDNTQMCISMTMGADSPRNM